VLVGAGAVAAVALVGCGGDDPVGSGSTVPSGSEDPGAGSDRTGVTAASTPTGSDGYVPGPGDDWETVDAADVGWSPEGLDAVAQLVESTNGRSLVLLSGGRLLVERYFAGATPDTAADIFSCQKSVTSVLVGIAQAGGDLAVDDVVADHLGAGWSHAPERAERRITIRHLLTMTSGLDPTTLHFGDTAGQSWAYNTNAYQKLRPLLEAATGKDIGALTTEALFDPIGVSDRSAWGPRDRATATDHDGEPLWGLSMTARDLARFALLAQRRGRWDGAQVVDPAWLEESWTPIPQKRDYGYLWWLMAQRPGAADGTPDDWVAALGAADQKVYVVPSLDLALVRQGLPADDPTEAASPFDRQLMAALLAARV
jgi:CubicO group peptidase (beta-lactamase class C family)